MEFSFVYEILNRISSLRNSWSNNYCVPNVTEVLCVWVQELTEHKCKQSLSRKLQCRTFRVGRARWYEYTSRVSQGDRYCCVAPCVDRGLCDVIEGPDSEVPFQSGGSHGKTLFPPFLHRHDPCLAPLGAHSLWIQYFISMRADGYPSLLELTYTKRNKSQWESFLSDRASQPEARCSSWPARANKATRNQRPPRVRFPLSLLLVSNWWWWWWYSPTWDICNNGNITLRAARTQNTRLSCNIYVGLHIFHFPLNIHIFERCLRDIFDCVRSDKVL
jgi:hypothetical protein